MTNPVEINLAILKAFGINPGKVFEVNIKITSDNYPVIHAQSCATELNDEGLAMVRHSVYELVHKKGDDDAAIEKSNKGETE